MTVGTNIFCLNPGDIAVPSKEAGDSFGWCVAFIFSHMKIVRKDIFLAPSGSEFGNGI
jgi:hypothetical protein